MSLALKQQFPFRLIIGTEDCTFLLDDSFSFSSVDPGGFEAASFQIPKDMPETLRGMYVRMDCGLQVAFEGRVSEIQRSLGSKTQITCQGYGALLQDQAASMVFVDRDLTQWQSPSYQRQINQLTAGVYSTLGSAQVAADPTSSLPALVLEIDDSWTTPIPIAEAWYDAGPENLVSEIFLTLNGNAVVPASAWTQYVFLSSDNVATTVEVSPNLSGGGSYLFTPATAYRFGLLQNYYNLANSGGQGQQALAAFSNVAVFGNHGLTAQGANPQGFYPSQLATWVIDQVPGLQPGVIPQTDATGYIMPHSVYYTPVTLDQMMGDFSTAAGWHWGVWESQSPLTGNATPRCDFRPRPQLGNWTAFCHRRDTTTCDVREDISQQYDTAVVTFSNVDGTNGAVTVTVDNPILDEVGIHRTLVLSGGTMTQATATLFGEIALAYTYSEARVAGSIQIEQAISGPNGPMAPWMLRPGIDRLRVGDLPSTDAFGQYNDVPLTRVEMSGSSSGFSTSVEVGVGADLVETIQSRLSAATALAGQGG